MGTMIKNLWARLTLHGRATALSLRLDRLESRRAKSLRDLRQRAKKVENVQQRLLDLISETEAAIQEAKRVQDEYREELEVARREVRILQETERGLIAANRVFLSRWEAESAVHAHQQGLIESNRETGQ